MEKYVKVKIFYWVVIVLAVINLGTLAIIWFDKPQMPDFREKPFKNGGPPPGHNLTDFFKERLDWSDEQAQKFKPLTEAYERESSILFDSIRQVRKQMFDEIFTDGSKRDSLINKITELQRRIDIQRYNHFKDISDICTPEQKEKFKDVINEVFVPMRTPESDDRGHRKGPPGGMPPPK